MHALPAGRSTAFDGFSVSPQLRFRAESPTSLPWFNDRTDSPAIARRRRGAGTGLWGRRSRAEGRSEELSPSEASEAAHKKEEASSIVGRKGKEWQRERREQSDQGDLPKLDCGRHRLRTLLREACDFTGCGRGCGGDQ